MLAWKHFLLGTKDKQGQKRANLLTNHVFSVSYRCAALCPRWKHRDRNFMVHSTIPPQEIQLKWPLINQTESFIFSFWQRISILMLTWLAVNATFNCPCFLMYCWPSMHGFKVILLNIYNMCICFILSLVLACVLSEYSQMPISCGSMCACLAY